MKRCCRCGEEKPYADYKRNKSVKDGFNSWCKACGKLIYAAKRAEILAYGRAYYQEHQEERKEYARQHAKTEAGRKVNAEYMAVRRGEIPPDARPALVKHRVWWLRYLDEHREERNAKSCAWAKRYPDRANARQREYKARWRATDPDSLRAFDRHHKRLWKARYPDRWAAVQTRQKARRRNAPGRFTGAEWSALKSRYHHRCLACGRREPDIKLTVDHVVPLVSGGSNDISNLQPLCMSCNCSKRDRTIDYRAAAD